MAERSLAHMDVSDPILRIGPRNLDPASKLARHCEDGAARRASDDGAGGGRSFVDISRWNVHREHDIALCGSSPLQGCRKCRGRHKHAHGNNNDDGCSTTNHLIPSCGPPGQGDASGSPNKTDAELTVLARRVATTA